MWDSFKCIISFELVLCSDTIWRCVLEIRRYFNICRMWFRKGNSSLAMLLAFRSSNYYVIYNIMTQIVARCVLEFSATQILISCLVISINCWIRLFVQSTANRVIHYVLCSGNSGYFSMLLGSLTSCRLYTNLFILESGAPLLSY